MQNAYLKIPIPVVVSIYFVMISAFVTGASRKVQQGLLRDSALQYNSLYCTVYSRELIYMNWENLRLVWNKIHYSVAVVWCAILGSATLVNSTVHVYFVTEEKAFCLVPRPWFTPRSILFEVTCSWPFFRVYYFNWPRRTGKEPFRNGERSKIAFKTFIQHHPWLKCVEPLQTSELWVDWRLSQHG